MFLKQYFGELELKAKPDIIPYPERPSFKYPPLFNMHAIASRAITHTISNDTFILKRRKNKTDE
jgi:hypothetical protein